MLRKYRGWVEVLLFFIVAAVLYLPFAKEFGYYKDDWYSMYSARVAGVEIFKTIYGGDRPARALLMAPLYTLFKGVPLYYTFSAYVLRVLGALSFLWLLRLLWTEQKDEIFLAALLFLIYPGFLDMPIAIDFQSHLLAMMCALLSLGLMVKSMQTQAMVGKLFLWLGAIFFGWVYLSQMEYYIGFELVRIAILALIFLRKFSWKKVFLPTLKYWLFYSMIPLGYVTWRQFIFDNTRQVTDLGIQLGKVWQDPILTLYAWAVNFLQSFVNVLVLSWGQPLYRLGFSLSIGKSLIALSLATSVFSIVLAFFYFLGDKNKESVKNIVWSTEAFWLGLAWIVFGLLTVILTNRSVSLSNYSRYGFVSSVGAVLVLTVLLAQFKLRRLQIFIFAYLIFSAVFTHYGNSFQYAEFSNDLRNFWWQISWRVPQFEAETTLIANYPNGGISETSFVWGPANHIYHAEPQSGNKINTRIYALVLNHDTISKILYGAKSAQDNFFAVRTSPDYSDILVITQPSEDSCVQIINGLQPEYSEYERETIMLVGEYSDPSHVLMDADFNKPPVFLFGEEPEHNWCYFYEKAALARQRQNWDEVITIYNEVSLLEKAPKDKIEWIPFLQAQVIVNDLEAITKIAKDMKRNFFVRTQVCEILLGMPETSPDAKNLVDTKICYHPNE